jgi:ATP-dependent Clp protease ATP-binding subunit ClpC
VFERFTDRARRVLVLAQEEARLLNHSFIGPEHILLGLLHERDGVVARALAEFDVTLDTTRQKVEEIIGHGEAPPNGSPPFTLRAKKVLELAREAHQFDHDHIGPEHLLLGVIDEGNSVGAQVLVQFGVDLVDLRRHVLEQIDADPDTPAATTNRSRSTPPSSQRP